MRTRTAFVALVCAVAALFSSSTACQNPSTTRLSSSAVLQIKAEIARLQQANKEKPVTDKDLTEIASAADNALKEASDALSAGQIYVSLEKLGRAHNLLGAARRGTDKSEVEKGGLPAFESQWGKVSLRLTALDQDAHNRDWKNATLALRGLAQAAQGRAIPLLEGGRGFATAKGPNDGLFYVGQAEGEADFAVFCNSLDLTSRPPSFQLRSFLPELQKLQQKTNAAFKPPKSIDLHSRFIALNSAIKLAEELDASKFYAGSLYIYLEALRNYGMLDQSPLDASQQARVKQDLTDARQKLAAASSDESIALLFLERAESYTAHADGSAPTGDEWRSARIILDQVLPAYYAAQKPAIPLQRASGKTVDITLVRWPYT
ncbi:MAG TPA: hypothetical protein VH437_19175 [Terriglobales bacterium]|jgi:hypothetical protein